MWKNIAEYVLKYRWTLLISLALTTVCMGYYASKAKISYEFSRAIPTDNPKYIDYVNFKNKFGDDGNLMVIGVQSADIFKLENFIAYQKMMEQIKIIGGVDDILNIPGAVNLEPDEVTQKLEAVKIFTDGISSQSDLDKAKDKFLSLGFYKHLLYNPNTNAYLAGIRINKEILNSANRTNVISSISDKASEFTQKTGIETYLSGLPLIRTMVANKVQKEMKFFLIGSLLLSIIILLIFFRSLATTIISILVVLIGVIWSLGILKICGYDITLLTALIPSLVVVIGIPNCIYFINKYHYSYLESNVKNDALINMVSKMGVVTLFCNITAAIGFAVFALTKSQILKEFGLVAGLSILSIFIISFILIPSVLAILRPPTKTALKYLDKNWIIKLLQIIEKLVFEKSKQVFVVTGILLLFSIAGIFQLKTNAHVVDDLPKTDKLYTDLKFFEKNFKGVMPLEILIDTKKEKGILNSTTDINSIAFFEDSVLAIRKEIGKPMSVVDGIKFSYQAISGTQGDSTYILPAFGNPLLDMHKSLRAMQIKRESNSLSSKDSVMIKLMSSFVDSSEQYLRISMSMSDIGTKKLKPLLDSLQNQSAEIFDSSAYKVTFTGTSITFLEGSKFIINGLKESICWAFLLIAICMLYLFRSFSILISSLLPNIIPLIFTAGIMGWVGVPLKPSTVLVFSVALGIAVDITIRFLVNYKQIQPQYNNSTNPNSAIRATIQQTGLSIIYTSLVLTVGFIIFCGSSFGGTFALGWLTSLTLITATATNLILLPCLLKKRTK